MTWENRTDVVRNMNARWESRNLDHDVSSIMLLLSEFYCKIFTFL